jgi:hypothetical protein
LDARAQICRGFKFDRAGEVYRKPHKPSIVAISNNFSFDRRCGSSANLLSGGRRQSGLDGIGLEDSHRFQEIERRG